ncbi:hypothetical protein [Mycolicibacterium sarraceniae]|uniref:Uncharacterized protein n=1 Tax=Mycolicibacterium sarraceniae TaxID=1534348 RepID=A0A7I7SXK5_9MYCO|nr:hypothetical protein [Mycolicibacterium sarraceniae]BBY61433.1 hypothetical protein MSAR_45690 [Mycolicibacterium sarraceniae]
MADVTDPNGVTWSVRRWWFDASPWESGFATLDALARAMQESAVTQYAPEA